MAQQLRPPAVLTEDLGLSLHGNSKSSVVPVIGNYRILLRPTTSPGMHMVHIHTCRQKRHTHKI